MKLLIITAILYGIIIKSIIFVTLIAFIFLVFVYPLLTYIYEEVMVTINVNKALRGERKW